MDLAQEYLEMMRDTADLIAKDKAVKLGNTASGFQSSYELTNEVEFWKWMGKNYPKDLSTSELIQRAANEKSRWLNTQIQGKGYEWDYMSSQRANPTNLLSKFDAGDCPTQPGIDITKSNIVDGSVEATYQNKAYLSNNNPNLHNTPDDAIVVTNSEKVGYAQKQGYEVEEYMNAKEIETTRDARFQKAAQGKATPQYTLQNVADASIKAGVMSSAIGMTVEGVVSYRAWKAGDLTDEQYMKEVLKAGGDAGITGTATAAIMVPVQATIVNAGISTIIGFPIAIVVSMAVNEIVAPCFGRGKYRQILNKAKYYQAMEDMYDDFLVAIEKSSNMYVSYINSMQNQVLRNRQMKSISKELDKSLKNLYDSI